MLCLQPWENLLQSLFNARHDTVPDESTRGKYAAISTGTARQIEVVHTRALLFRGRVRPLPQPRRWFAAARYGRDRDRSSRATAARRPNSAIRPARDWSQAERLRRNSAQAGAAWL